jgi:hypothetical protein
MPNYLEFFPQPLLVDLCEGQVLPFIGSGFSLNAIVPPGRVMPLYNQMAACLNELMPDYVGNSSQDVFSEFEFRYGRAQLIEEFYKMLLIGVAQPGPAHLAFARLPFDLVATTNIDQLLEQAYFAVNRFPQVVMFEDQLPVHDTADDPVELLKVHGDINFPDRVIWTEHDYDTFIERYPLYVTYLASLLITNTALFIGYSLNDYDLRIIWEIIGDRLGRLRRTAYAIEPNPSQSTIERFARRGVQVIGLRVAPGQNFGEVLAETFQQLRFFLANGCPPPGIPPCDTLGVGIDVSLGEDDGSDGPDGSGGSDESDGSDGSDESDESDDRENGRCRGRKHDGRGRDRNDHGGRKNRRKHDRSDDSGSGDEDQSGSSDRCRCRRRRPRQAADQEGATTQVGEVRERRRRPPPRPGQQ